MKVLLYEDDTLSIDLDSVAAGMKAGTTLDVRKGRAKFEIKVRAVRDPETYDLLDQQLYNEADEADLSLCLTRIPYENNYFYQFSGKIGIVSFYAWEQLTSLPFENGIVYFVSSLLRSRLSLPAAHHETTGCLNDFLWDKTGVDVGMRAGVICDSCTEHLIAQTANRNQSELLKNLRVLLHDLGVASR